MVIGFPDPKFTVRFDFFILIAFKKIFETSLTSIKSRLVDTKNPFSRNFETLNDFFLI